jgi:hypothetical protein
VHAVLNCLYSYGDLRGVICDGRQTVSQPESDARLSTTTTRRGLGEMVHV